MRKKVKYEQFKYCVHNIFFHHTRAWAPWVVFFTIGVVYTYFSTRIMGSIFTPTHYNYYMYLLDAFAHGRVNVTPPSIYDLSLYHGKWYLYWGPAPVLLLWPFYLIWGLNVSDVLYTMLGGLANVVLIFLCLGELKRYFRIPLSLLAETVLLLSFAFASPLFFLSIKGNIYATTQVFATTYSLLFYLFFFKYLRTDKLSSLVLAVTFFCLACLTRYSLLFQGVLFIYLFWERKKREKKLSVRLLLSLAIPVLLFVGVGAFYNYLKFQNIFEVGQRFQQGSGRYSSILASGKTLSFTYVWHNIYYYFLNPISFSLSQHKLGISSEGNSVLMVYPCLLLVSTLFFTFKGFDAKKRCFVLVVSAAAALTIGFLMLYFSTGWIQFGNRYFFDAFPLCFLLLVLVMQSIPKPVQMGVAIWGIVINFWGVLTFLGK